MNDIRIITEPQVRLVGRLSVDDEAIEAFLREEGVDGWQTDTEVAAQKLVEVAGRLCYKSYAKPRPGGNAAYIGHILEVGHGSVIEHAIFNFIITGVSRSFTHELVRHRAGWAYSQRSQRFCDESDASFVPPPGLADEVARARTYILNNGFTSAEGAMLRTGKSPHADISEDIHAGLVWLMSMERSQWSYAWLSEYGIKKLRHRDYSEWESSLPADTLSNGFWAWMDDQPQEAKTHRRKKAREAARSVLPNATETQVFVTANARAIRTFLELRGSPDADAEIRRVALALYRVVAADSPHLFADFSVGTSADGAEYLACQYHKV